METTFNIISVINAFGAFQCILTAVALFGIKRSNQTANRLFAFFLIATALIIFNAILEDTRLILNYPHLTIFLNPPISLVGPLYLLYSKSITTVDFQFRKSDLWHFVLFAVLQLLLLTEFAVSKDALSRLIMEELNNPVTSVENRIILWIINVQVLVYFILSYVVLTKRSRVSRENASTRNPVNLTWLKGFTLAIIFISALSAVLDFSPELDVQRYNTTITPFFITMIVFAIVYVGIRQSELFSGKTSQKYQKSVLTDEMAEVYLQKLDHLMTAEKVFLDENIRLPELAKRLKISGHLLSQILNERLDRNFFNFISEYRVNEAKKRLLDPSQQQFTMQQLAYDVGFNSLSAFNTAFKKHTGISPSQYKKENLSEDN